MAENRRIVFVAVHRFLQSILGLSQLVLLVIGPAHAVEVSAVIRFLVHCPLNQRDGLIQPDTTIRQNVTKKVQS